MTPDVLAKSKSEHAEQRALFAWANMACRFGFLAAWDDLSYTTQGHAEKVRIANVIAFGGPVGVPALAMMFAIPNGGFRDKITAGKLKAEGVKAGVPDVFLPLIVGNWAGLFVELKRQGTVKVGTRKAAIVDQAAGSTSNVQDEWIGKLRNAGYGVAVAFGWREAAKQVQSYIEWKGK